MANLISEIAKMLGVELGEEFKVKGHGELTYKLASDGLKFAEEAKSALPAVAKEMGVDYEL